MFLKGAKLSQKEEKYLFAKLVFYIAASLLYFNQLG